MCAFNDAPAREQCSDGSIERDRSEVDDLAYVLSPQSRLVGTDRAERGAGGGTAASNEVDALRHGNTA